MKNSLTPEHKALIFVGFVGLLGAGVRISRALSPLPASADFGVARLAPGTPQPELEQQIAAADSAAADTGTGRSRARRRRAPSQPGRRAGMAPPAARLDVDTATAAQLDSLPGVGPALAQRIIADRSARGPFGSLAGLMRVPGIGPATGRRLDSLVTFSGIARPASAAADSTSPKRQRKRPARPRPRPPPGAVS